MLDSNDGLGNLSTLDLSIRDSTNDEPELDLHGHDETIGGLTGGGSVRNSGAASTLTLGAAGTDQVFSGLIEGPLSLIKTGGGAFTLASEANITGMALVNAGMLIANSKLTAAQVATGDAGTLSGSGSVAANVALQSGSTLAPGTPSAPGSLSTRSLQFQSGSRLQVRAIDIGANQYDRVQAAGTVTIAAGAQLVIVVGATPIPLGTTFRIIDNDGTTDAVNGTFQGLPEGGTLTASNRLFRISYRGGDGNDVVLTAVPNTPPAISDITDRIVALGASTGSIPFTVGDAETLADDLAVSASSDNGTLVPAAAIQLGGSGANRTITVIPAAGQVRYRCNYGAGN